MVVVVAGVRLHRLAAEGAELLEQVDAEHQAPGVAEEVVVAGAVSARMFGPWARMAICRRCESRMAATRRPLR